MKKHYSWIVLAIGVMALAVVACATPFTTPKTQGPVSPVSVTAQAAPIEEVMVDVPVIIPTPVSEAVIAEADAEELLLINIYQRVNPAVVNIDVSAEMGDVGSIDFGSGSGFVIDTDGHIVTNNHVVTDADEVRVTFSDGTVLIADVLGTDIYSDLAVLKVDPPKDKELITVELGDSDNLLVGQRVVAIGNPFGLSGSMTVGIVSAVGRTLPAGVTNTGVFSNPLIIQTDAAINPGNSGGPLLNSQGEVIGVNGAIRTETGSNTGVGFAIPVNTVKRIASQIIENGKVEYPYLGISANGGVTLAELAVEYDLPVTYGVLISEVSPGFSADRAGLRGGDPEDEVSFRGSLVRLGGDIIIAIDDYPIRDFDQLIGYLVSYTSVGEEITVTIVRDGETLDIPVTLDARPDD